ncbi:MAG: ATP-dependent Clp protease proteolytic subunit [Paraburkholderia sp.]|uniref:ATP-dependent Clp protease proteolytic subunit n=1 Tax=Paraburkholderia sp. TaxID=1926495 RepID=UPI003C666083
MRSIEHRTVTHAAASGWITRFLGWLCFTVLMIPGVAPAMDFKIYYQPQLKLKMIIAEGRIQDGDADKFMALAKLADRDDEGLVILVLNSPGGNVEAAFRVVDAMDSVRVYTAVPDNARCASACASILFASGERRSVVGTGLLGFHSCYRRDGRTYAEDSLCNEIIAANAMQRGVSHAGINRFVKQYGATDMAWVGHDEACKSLQGLCKPGLLEIQRGTKTALMQSFDCSKLISVQDQLICGDSELASVDKALATVYGRKMKVLANRTRLRADQRAWLRSSRNACADKACLLQSYHLRIDELKRMRSQ